MTAQPFNLDQIKLASPCNASWNDMEGDDRTRFCEQCSKHVYNLSGMTREEAVNLIHDRSGSVCVRFLRRADGTILNEDCPIGWWDVRARAVLLWGMAAAMMAFILFGEAGFSTSNSNTTFEGIGGGISDANT
jgi:hypothetical protein